MGPIMALKVKDFWTEPKDPPLTARSITFGYTDDHGKKFKYKAEIKGDDLFNFHAFVHALLDAKRKSLLPWVIVKDLKNKVKITNTADESEQIELSLKVASRFLWL
jgi:hypothetical protein